MAKRKIVIRIVEDGSKTDGEEEFTNIGAAVNWLVKLEKKELIWAISKRLDKRKQVAENKQNEDLRHFEAVGEGLEEASQIVWSESGKIGKC